jgi:hypothetical protein
LHRWSLFIFFVPLCEMSSQVIHTVCMQTSDAIKKSEGEFVMKLGGDNPRLNAVKIALGSLELPMVQWTIEEDWNHIYFSEGYKINQEASWLRIDEKTDIATNTIQIHLPLYLNAIASIKQIGEYLNIKTEYPHGLWADGKRSIIPCINWGEVSIICSCIGKISLTTLVGIDQIEYLSETEFMIPNVHMEAIENSHFGYVHLPTIPSPQALCDLLTFNFTYAKSLGSYHVQYDSKCNVANILSSKYPDDASYLRIRLFGCNLVKLLGYMSDEHNGYFVKKKEKGLSIPVVRFDLPEETEPPLMLKSEPFPGWMAVNIMPGWYAPSNRPMCTGQPLRINTEFESAFNRLHFSVPEKIPRGHATSHFIVFCDPTGIQHMCPIFAGKYSSVQFCTYLEDEMTKLASKVIKDIQFSIDYDTIEKKFTFSCEIRQSKDQVTPAPFSLLFNHPASIDSSRIGFPVVNLKGSDTYTSEEVVIPFLKWNSRHHFNTYNISEISHQKRFLLEAFPISQMIGVIKEFDKDSSELILMTHVGQLPFVHGLQVNDVVSIMPTNKCELFVNDTGTWETKEFATCPIAPIPGKSGVVMELNAKYLSSIFVRIKVRFSGLLANYIDKVVAINTDVEPYNLCFGTLPRSIPSKTLGFGHGAIQWGIDGSITSGNLKIAPYIAKAVHCLDHPDYVLVFLEEGKKNLSLQHTVQNNSTSHFAKLVLYPMFREERMLPRDTTLLGSELYSKFTISFKNPDMTPYHFHDADFSFSLNFIRSSGD